MQASHDDAGGPDGGPRGGAARILPTLVRTVAAVLVTVGLFGTLRTPPRSRPAVGLRSIRPAFTGQAAALRPALARAGLGVEAAEARYGRGAPEETREGRLRELEPRLRELVAEVLAVNADELVPAVSLTDDLAADSLDMVQLLLAIEYEFDLTLPAHGIDGVRTFRDLVEMIASLEHPGPEQAWVHPPPIFRSRLVPAATTGHGSVTRVDALTPYAIQTMADDARPRGQGARLEVVLLTEVDEATLGIVRRELAALDRRGIETTIRHDGDMEPQGTRPSGPEYGGRAQHRPTPWVDAAGGRPMQLLDVERWENEGGSLRRPL